MYDPLSDISPGQGEPYQAHYWQQATRIGMPQLHSARHAPEQVDVLVVGAGYTGLNAALELAEKYQQQVLIVEANQLGWGCSTRNAGFAMPSTGRLGYAAWQKQFGDEVARGIQREYAAAFERLERFVESCPEGLQRQYGGYLKIANSKKAVPQLHEQFKLLQQFEPECKWLNQEQLATRLHSPKAFSAIHFPQSFGLNPWLLLASVARQALDAGVNIMTETPVTHCESTDEGYLVQTPKGAIRAKKLIVATNAYTPNKLFKPLHGRSLPALSSVLVTRPLTAEEQQQVRLSPQELVMDTRALKYYFRMLPDGRLLFGGRGAIRGKDADRPRYQEDLRRALADTFPQLQALCSEPAEYFWSGWVSVAFDDYPRIFSPAKNMYTSMGYCGAGVTFSQLAGQRLAQLSMGEKLPELPFYQSPLPKFPLPYFRRLGQWLYYQWASRFM